MYRFWIVSSTEAGRTRRIRPEKKQVFIYHGVVEVYREVGSGLAHYLAVLSLPLVVLHRHVLPHVADRVGHLIVYHKAFNRYIDHLVGLMVPVGIGRRQSKLKVSPVLKAVNLLLKSGQQVVRWIEKR